MAASVDITFKLLSFATEQANFLHVVYLTIVRVKVYLGPCQTYITEIFEEIVNG